MNFETLIPESIILELRYTQGFMYWDNCGKIFKEVAENWKDIGRETVNIKEAMIRFPERNVVLKFSPELINVSLLNSKNIKFFGEFADSVVKTICNQLEIEVFSRVGNRFQFLNPLESPNDFSKIFGSTGLLRVPEGVISQLGDQVEKQEVKFTINKDESFGYNFRFAQFRRSINIELPPQIKIDDSKFISEGIEFDLDIFTIKPVLLSSLNCGELLRKNMKDYEFLIKKFI